MTEEVLRRTVQTCLALGCRSVHIGGGEPFLDTTHLLMVARVCQELGLGIDYIETNASWFVSMDQSVSVLEQLLQAGVGTLLVSISPFHNEFIPFEKTKGVLAACRKTGMGIFPWVMEFYGDLDVFESGSPHGLREYEEKFGSDYLARTLNRYWVHFGGRALKTFRPLLQAKSLPEILLQAKPCMELEQTSHFHFDPNGDYIPGLCSHLRISRVDATSPITARDTEWINILYSVGIAGCIQKVSPELRDELHKRSYVSKCDLCQTLFTTLTTTSS